MKKLAFCLWISLLFSACTGRHTFTSLVSDPPIPARNFTMTSGDGSTFRLSDLRGQYILLSFGYTHCPDVCPTTLAQLRVAREQLGDAASQVEVVFVSVDPERDTPGQLQGYARAFSEDFWGVTGTREEIDSACAVFGAKYKIDKTETQSAAGYEVSHSAYVYVIDPDFQLRLTIPFGAQANEIAADLQALMRDP